MRIVHEESVSVYPPHCSPSDWRWRFPLADFQIARRLAGELERAASESLRNFNDGRLILEKYIASGKHIEVQIFGDSHGSIISLFERECSVQRRHQKVIEETPSPNLSQEQREKICAAAREIGALLGYENAGTVEFIWDVVEDQFYFLEVNTRLQVEHPITEMVSGIDLVSLLAFVPSYPLILRSTGCVTNLCRRWR